MSDAFTREELAEFDTFVPELIEPVAPPAALRAQILAAVGGVPQGSLTIRAEEDRWRPFPAPGVRWKKLSSDRERGTLTVLLQIDPGAAVPSHGHHGSEDCFVVEGSCHIGSITLAKGDFHRVERGARHGTVQTKEGCTLLLVVAAEDWAA